MPDNYEEVLEVYTKEGYRVIALAEKPLPSIKMDSVMSVTRDDVESDLKNINRLSTRVKNNNIQYNPTTNKFTNAPYVSPPDESVPQLFNRLTNPPCTLRTTGWNRWEPLPHQPQLAFETPFDFFIPSRDIDKEKAKTH